MPRIRTHPGEVLREEFMAPLKISANALARDLHVPPNRISSIIAEHDPRSGVRGHRNQAGALFRHQRGILAQSAACL